MLTIEEIKKALDAGEVVELECIDRDGFLSCQEWRDKNKEILNKEKIIAEAIIGPPKYDKKAVGLMGDGGTSEVELKYFRIKSIEPTFDDLIDVLIKAKRDNIISRVEINSSSLNATVNLTDSKEAVFCTSKDAGGVVFKGRIDWINSLYTETFVIENEDQVELVDINRDCNVKLTNGVVLIPYFKFEDDIKFYKEGNKNLQIDADFLFLKGATVTQKRGAQ